MGKTSPNFAKHQGFIGYHKHLDINPIKNEITGIPLMIKLKRYIKSLFLQSIITLCLLSIIAINDLLHGAQFIWLLPTMKSAYIELSYNLYDLIFDPEMTPQLGAIIREVGFYVRILFSFIIAFISIWKRYKYALIIDGVVTLISMLMFIFSALQ